MEKDVEPHALVAFSVITMDGTECQVWMCLTFQTSPLEKISGVVILTTPTLMGD